MDYKLFKFIRVDGIAGYSNFNTPVYGVRIGYTIGIFQLGNKNNNID
jgi:hypothetical protein